MLSELFSSSLQPLAFQILKTIESAVSDLFLDLFPKPGFAVTYTPAKSFKGRLLLFLSPLSAKALIFLFKTLHTSFSTRLLPCTAIASLIGATKLASNCTFEI